MMSAIESIIYLGIFFSMLVFLVCVMAEFFKHVVECNKLEAERIIKEASKLPFDSWTIEHEIESIDYRTSEHLLTTVIDKQNVSAIGLIVDGRISSVYQIEMY